MMVLKENILFSSDKSDYIIYNMKFSYDLVIKKIFLLYANIFYFLTLKNYFMLDGVPCNLACHHFLISFI